MEKKAARTGGSLKISNDVMAKIAELAATEIQGVCVDGQKLSTPDNAFAIASKLLAPIKVCLTSEAAEIDVSIIVQQGFKAVSVAEAVQASIKSAVQNMTGIPVSKVNVKIVGIKLAPEETA